MHKNRFIPVLGLLSMLLVAMAVSQSRPLVSSATGQAASDFYQRHPDWTWSINRRISIIPATGASAFSDYFQRHLELNIPVERSIDTTDYFFRHLESTTASLAIPFGVTQIRRESLLGERYGVTPQGYIEQRALREYWLGERYGQTPIVRFTNVVNECFYVPVSEIACRNQNQAP